MTYKYYFSANEKPDELEDLYEFESDTKYGEDHDSFGSLEELAEEIAQYEWDHNEGHDYSWPVEYHIWNKKREYLGSFLVHMDMHPTFTAYEFEDKK